MVLNPDATSSSEILPVPGAANKSNWPSALGATFLAIAGIFSSEVLSAEFTLVALSTAKVFVKLVNKFLNSNSLKSAVTFSISGWSSSKSFALKVTGTSSIIVASFLESKPKSFAASTFSFIFPFSSCVLANRFSIEP